MNFIHIGLETIDKLIQTTYLQDEIDELSLDKIHFNSFSPEICKKIGTQNLYLFIL